MNIDPNVPKEHGNVQHGYSDPVPEAPPTRSQFWLATMAVLWVGLTLIVGLVVEVKTIVSLFHK